MKLLVVGAGPLQAPAIEEAKSLGVYTIAVDANPAAIGFELADQCQVINITDRAEILNLARRNKIDGVMSVCTDMAVRTVAHVAEELGLPALSPVAALASTDKRLMRRAFQAAGAPSPRFAEASSLSAALESARALGFPVAVKTARSSGSRGVSRADDEAGVVRGFAAAQAYETGAILVEEWLEGPEISVEGVCVGPAPHLVQMTDKSVFDGPFPVESGHRQPSCLCDSERLAVQSAVTTGVQALGLSDCGFHAELKIVDGRPKLIEIGARLGGDRISTHLTPLSTGVNLVRATVELALGRKPSLEPKWNRGASIRYFFAGAAGTAERIEGLEQVAALDGLELFFPESERDGPLGPGFRVPDIRSSLDRYGHVVFSGSTGQEAAARAEHAINLVRFHFRA